MPSPLLDLPNELQLEIIKYVLDSEATSGSPSGILHFVLASVCHHWRILVNSTPFLWTSIVIDKHCVSPRSTADAEPKDIFVRTAIALENSAYRPIDLTILLPDFPTPSFSLRDAYALARLLGPEANRVKSIFISGNNWEMHLAVLEGFNMKEMPALRSFSHIMWQHCDLSQYDTFTQLTPWATAHSPILTCPIQDADRAEVNSWGREKYPQLIHIRIQGAPYDLARLPTSNLQELTLGNQPGGNRPNNALLQQMLSTCSHTLQILYLSGIFQSGVSQHKIPCPVNLPRLDTLYVAYDNPNDLAHFLPLIHAPGLNTLSISDTSNLMNGTSSFSRRSTDNMVAAMMAHLPLARLETLELDHIVFCDDIPTPMICMMQYKGLVPEPYLPLTLGFLRSLSVLKHLVIRAKDNSFSRFLFSLNLPATPRYSLDGELLSTLEGEQVHLSSLDMIEFDVSTSSIDEVYRFVLWRALRAHNVNPLHILVPASLTRELRREKRLEFAKSRASLLKIASCA